MAQKVLNPLGTEAFGLQKSGNRVAKEMGIQMGEAGIGIGHPGFDAQYGDFCTTLRNGALSRCRSDVSKCQLTSADLILLSIE